MLCFYIFPMILTGTYRHSNNKSSQSWRSRIHQHIFLPGNRLYA